MTPFGGPRYDYRFPLRINSAQNQAERAGYPEHVAQMIRQFLLTAPGERVCLPHFGAGLRRMIFAPKTAGLASASELLIRQGLDAYLGTHISVSQVEIRTASALGEGVVEIHVSYRLKETQTDEHLILQGP